MKYKTIVSLPEGYFGSNSLWVDPLYAIQNGRRSEFEHIGGDRTEVSKKLDIPKDHLPEWWEWAEYMDGKLT